MITQAHEAFFETCRDEKKTPALISKVAAQTTSQYGSGSFSGNEYIDQVTISEDLVVFRQSIGVANTSQGINNIDGILGVGPVQLTNGTLSPITRHWFQQFSRTS